MCAPAHTPALDPYSPLNPCSQTPAPQTLLPNPCTRPSCAPCVHCGAHPPTPGGSCGGPTNSPAPATRPGRLPTSWARCRRRLWLACLLPHVQPWSGERPAGCMASLSAAGCCLKNMPTRCFAQLPSPDRPALLALVLLLQVGELCVRGHRATSDWSHPAGVHLTACPCCRLGSCVCEATA